MPQEIEAYLISDIQPLPPLGKKALSVLDPASPLHNRLSPEYYQKRIAHLLEQRLEPKQSAVCAATVLDAMTL